MQQIQEKQYAAPYLHHGKSLLGIGISRSSITKSMDDYIIESLN